ncbi:MAG: hypothetical protein KTR31_06605 [Myxococcales bacterium]|nr:hypothetical protein [Myxococcales bacterium]
MARLGLDIGKVIIGPIVDGRADTSFLGTQLDDAMSTPPAPGAFSAIRTLVDRFDEVWLVSKCGPSVQRKTRAWLDHHDFYRTTGVPSGHLRFCLKRHEKAPIAMELGLTDFVDDRRDVLVHMRGLVPRLYLFGEQTEAPPQWTIHVADWPATVAQLRGRRAA